ncbi:hypothetical protein [Streptomyces sp. NPDC050560]|uniref:hypothetical protein n=1 Tax=Streptomyces sp. NPDC050560 TaxID=3365630 RepID=UPI0037B2089E
MSRENDSPSSGPQGRGGTAYPSGTPPYGVPAGGPGEGAETTAGADGAQGRGAAGEPGEERRTETTLTTRVRINIPGSRPIPPVVMRTPMSDANAAAQAPGEAAEAKAEPPAAEEPEPEEQPRTSDWFAPRKPKNATPPGASGAATGSGFGAGARAQGGQDDPGQGGAELPPGPAGDTGSFYSDYGDYPDFGAGGARGEHPGHGGPGDPFAGHDDTGGHYAPQDDTAGQYLPGDGPSSPFGTDDTGGFPVAEQTAQFPAVDPTGQFAVQDQTGQFPVPEQTGQFPAPSLEQTGQFPAPSPEQTGQFAAPSPEQTAQFPAVDATGQFPAPGGQGGPFEETSTGGLGVPGQEPPRSGLAGLDDPAPGAPGGPTASGTGDSTLTPGRPGPNVPGAGGQGQDGLPPRLSDDTAVLTPQRGAKQGGPAAGGPGDHVSGSTLTSGIPPAPPGAGAPGQAAQPHTPPKLPEPPQRQTKAAAPPPKKKGRSKLTLLLVAVIVLAGVAYGAGLVMNHSDVPKGTTVLGVDIGGGTRDDAVKKLDAAFGKNMARPIQLTVGDEKVPLSPEQAGLTLDEDATVQSAARSDYNPVTVIGSLFSGEREVQPAMPVDEEKLHAALERAAGEVGSATEGSIRFEPNKAVPVYGKEGSSVDVGSSVPAVEEAYRTQVETGRAEPVKLPVSTRKPTVSKAEVDRMMKDFAQPAMSGIVTVKAGDASIPLGPAKSLPRILGVKAVDGKLVETYDKAAVKELIGNTFDGVLITRGSGQKTAVQPEDVIVAMRKALLGKTPAERVGVIPTS